MASSKEARIASIRNTIKSYPNFPQPGILFRDIFSVLLQPTVFEDLVSLLLDHILETNPDVDGIVGLEARGFLLGPPLALRLKVPFIPVRKAGKLPGEVRKASYTLEYGTSTVELQAAAVTGGQKVVVIDDLLATGGTMKAAVKLLREAGTEVKECIVVIELKGLNGTVGLDAPFFSLVELPVNAN